MSGESTTASSIFESVKDVGSVLGAAGTAVGAVSPFLMQDDTPEFEAAETSTLEDMEAEAAEEAEARRLELLRRQGVQSTIRTSPMGVSGVDVSAPTFGVTK